MTERDMTTRRALLGTLGSVALAASAAAASAPSAAAERARDHGGSKASALDLATPAGNVLAMAKLVGDTSGRTKHGWYRGTLIGLADGEAARDLLGIVGMSTQRLTPLTDRPGWQLLQKEVGFFTDLDSGAVLDRWVNPYNGEAVEPFHIANDAVNRTIEPVVRRERFYDAVNESAPPPQPFVLPWRRAGDRVFVEQRLHVWAKNPLDPARWPRESSGPEIRVSDMLSYNASYGQLADPGVTAVEYWGHWMHLRPWQPWMLMGSTPGGCAYSAFTGSASTLDDVPAEIVALTRARFPDFLEPPTVLKRSEPSAIRFMRERKPVR